MKRSSNSLAHLHLPLIGEENKSLLGDVSQEYNRYQSQARLEPLKIPSARFITNKSIDGDKESKITSTRTVQKPEFQRYSLLSF